MLTGHVMRKGYALRSGRKTVHRIQHDNIHSGRQTGEPEDYAGSTASSSDVQCGQRVA